MVLRKGLGKLSTDREPRGQNADREPRGQNADRAKPERGAKEVRGKGRTELHERESTMNRNKNPVEKGVDPRGRGGVVASLP